MQQPQQMMPMMSSYQPTNITTEQIQKYLDDNKKLILAILEFQNMGKLAECAQYQAQLQKNLMYLAAIADAQPQASAMAPQMAPHAAMQQGAYYMQYQQAAAMAQQAGLFSAKMPLQYNSPHQSQDPHQLHQQAMQGQLGMRSMGPNNGMHSMHSDATLGGGGGPSAAGVSNDGRGDHKQDDAGNDGHGGDGNKDGK